MDDLLDRFLPVGESVRRRSTFRSFGRAKPPGVWRRRA